MNKSQRQRIIVFVGHPIEQDLSECENLGKRLKRNNVAIDVVNFAHPDNVPKLEALVQCANNSDNSHFMDVPIGVAMITDVLITSPILQPDAVGDVPMANAGAANVAESVVNRFAEYGGYNPDMDPEMAMAMKISMDEARANQKAQEEKQNQGAQNQHAEVQQP
jgi:26S proteasome regulatory subunit N10